MKKIVALLLLALALSTGTVLAADLPLSVEAGLFTGEVSYESEGVTVGKEDANGFWASADVTIREPFGAIVNLITLDGETFDGLRYDLLGSYAIPGMQEYALRALAGYSNTKLDYDDYTVTFKGFLVGVRGEFSPVDELTVSGTVGFGVGMDVTQEMELSSDTRDLGLLTYNVVVSYAVTDSIAVEAGYRGDNYSISSENIDEKASGFVLGARMTF